MQGSLDLAFADRKCFRQTTNVDTPGYQPQDLEFEGSPKDS